VWNRGVAPIGKSLGRTDDEIADMVLKTIDSAAEMVNIKLMHERLVNAKKRRENLK
jgi:hypothetical protein